MLGVVGLRTFHVISNVIRCWTVGFIDVVRFVTMGSAHFVGRNLCIGANVGRRRRRGSVVRGTSDVKMLATAV